MEPGITFHEIVLKGRSASTKLWLYLPDGRGKEKVPCVLIAPAGSRLFHGMALTEGDRPEHLPYARAGFAVAAYEIEGALSGRPTNAEVIDAARAFKDAQAGIANADAALEYVLAHYPEIDPDRVYSAGHSSAATLSLLVAAHNPRIKGCIAFAPECDVAGRVGDSLIKALSSSIAEFREFLERSSPKNVIDKLRPPVFLFHADDDSVVPADGVTRFLEDLKKKNGAVTFVHVAAGGHYDSMIDEGIPKAIEWLKALPGSR